MRDHLNAALADRYSVERELGRGGMASVWLARDLRHDRLVAIKVLDEELAGAIGVDRFVREIRLTACVQHPHIVPVLDSGAFPGPNGVSLPWYAMTYIAGESLRQRLDRERHVPVEDALHIAEQAAAALHAAHEAGVVHRDIKPENLLLVDGHTYVADFGIAKALIETGGERLTNTGIVVGTPAYMSPEQATAEAVDARSDQYSLACVLYEMLAGEPPFTGPTAQAIIARRLTEPLRPVRSAVPVAVEAALLRALERIPADRFPDVSSFAAALRNATVTQSGLQRRARSMFRALGATVALGLVALAGWWGVHRRGHAQPPRDPEVVALYERGVRGYDQRTPAGIQDAIAAFTAAVQRDSAYAAAWAGLANTYARAFERRFVFSGVERDSALRLALAAVDRALILDRRNADVWVAQAIVSRQLDPTDVTPVFRSVRQALAIDSSNARAWHYLALSYAESGDLNQALATWRRSVRANPSFTQGLAFLALGHYWRRQYDSAAWWTDSAIAVDPNYVLGRFTAGQVAVELGHVARGRAAFEAARRLSTEVGVVEAEAGSALVEARGGSAREARRILQRGDSLAMAYQPAPLHTAVYFAQAYAALGDADHAIAWLRQYAPREDLHFQLHLRCDPTFDPIAREPGFQSLLLGSRPARGC
ncbi:MAG TPA: protein kinase [Gemmatimonadales bacterium]|nr:protein kinase [Gemmatimonadales bacterium]